MAGLKHVMRLMVRMWRWHLAGVLIGGLLAAPVYADALGVVVQRVDASQFPTLRAWVSVSSINGVPVRGLDAGAFQVQEDGKPVEGLVVEQAVDSQDPILTALVLDVGGTMNDERKLDRAREAATAFIDALGTGDRATVVSFASRVTVVQDYTVEKEALRTAIDSFAARGNRLLYDAVTQTARRQSSQTERRKPLILLTDGPDNGSTATLDASISAASAAGVPIYAIGVGSAVNKDVLLQIASRTGGQAVFVDDPASLKATFLSINDQLRRQYVLSYTSKLAADGNSHGLAVQALYQGQQATGLKSFTIAGVAPTAKPVSVAPTSPPATVAPAPTLPAVTVAIPSTAPSQGIAGIDYGLLLGIFLLLVLVAATVWYLRRGSPTVAVAMPGPPIGSQETQIRGDRTEIVGGTLPGGGATMMRPGRERPAPEVRLTLVRHGQQSDFATRDSPITLGRAKDRATVPIDDPLVSSEHVRIRRDGAQFSIEDLNSKNGTQINGEPMTPGTRRPLKSNDRIYLGDTVVTFVVDSR